MKKKPSDPALDSWIKLNDALRDADEGRCNELLAAELKGRKRKVFVSRIHSRLNKARADRERLELTAKVDAS